MNIKQKIIHIGLFLSIVTGAAAIALPTNVAAEDCVESATVKCCGNVKTSILSCPQTGKGDDVQNSGVWGILLIVLNIMTAGVGILGVGGIVYGAVLYASAADDASQVSQAKDIIKNVVIGLIAFLAMYLLLNFLIPGGIFS